jgi:hypothetical protein
VYVPFDIWYTRLEDVPFEPKHVDFKHDVVLQLGSVVLAVFLLIYSAQLFRIQEEL